MDNTPVLITYEYLHKHKTPKGAWTKKQIQALGLRWPLVQGWQELIIGDQITIDQARIFETENVPVSNKKQEQKKPNIDQYIAYLFKNVNRLTPQQIVRIRNIESKYLDLRK